MNPRANGTRGQHCSPDAELADEPAEKLVIIPARTEHRRDNAQFVGIQFDHICVAQNPKHNLRVEERIP